MVSPQGPSSFIPKSPQKSTARPRGIRKIYVFTYVSLVFFFGTLLASAGTFFFDLTVQNQLAQQKQELANERNAFNAQDLDRLRQLEQRIENAKSLLGAHVSVADIFNALETSTVSAVQLTGVEYERSDAGNISLTLSALTNSLNDARFQQDIYASNEVLRKLAITEPTLSIPTDGDSVTGGSQEIVFTLAGGLQVSDIPYRGTDTPPASTLPVDNTDLFDDESDVVDGDPFTDTDESSF